jgi:hypothetical protein
MIRFWMGSLSGLVVFVQIRRARYCIVSTAFFLFVDNFSVITLAGADLFEKRYFITLEIFGGLVVGRGPFLKCSCVIFSVLRK